MQIQNSNEIDLIRQTLAGDTSAFDQLVKAHRRTIYVLVISCIKNPADAEDLTQQIFIQAYERLVTLRQLDRFLPWLQQIAHNACKDWLRHQSDLTTSFDEVNDADFTKTAPSPEEIALKREVKTVVREAIGVLQETDRKLVEGHYIEGASYDQLQIESGLSHAAIASRLNRAKQQMRRRIEKLLGGMAILPGRTLIFGGIETVKLSVKTKLAVVGVAAVIGTGGGVWYHHSLVSEPEAITKEHSTEIEKPSVAESRTAEEWKQLDAAIASLKALDKTVEGQTEPSETQDDTIEQTQNGDAQNGNKIILKLGWPAADPPPALDPSLDQPIREFYRKHWSDPAMRAKWHVGVEKARQRLLKELAVAETAVPAAQNIDQKILDLHHILVDLGVEPFAVGSKRDMDPEVQKVRERIRELELERDEYLRQLEGMASILFDKETDDILGSWLMEKAGWVNEYLTTTPAWISEFNK